MTKNIHKGLILDDNFNKAMRAVQNGIESLEVIADDYGSSDIRPVNSQLFKLTVAIEDLEKLKTRFMMLNSRSAKS